MIHDKFISFSAVEIYDLSYIHLQKFTMWHFLVCSCLFPAFLTEKRTIRENCRDPGYGKRQRVTRVVGEIRKTKICTDYKRSLHNVPARRPNL